MMGVYCCEKEKNMKINIVNFSILELTKTMNARLFVEEEINEIINEPNSLNKNKKIMEKFENYPQRFEEMRTKLYLIYSLKLKNLEDYGIYILNSKVKFNPKTQTQLMKQKELYVFLYLIENKLIKVYMTEELRKVNEQMQIIKKEIEFLNQFKGSEKPNEM